MGWWQEQRRAWADDWGGLARDTTRTVGTTARAFGFLTRLAVYSALLFALYIFWPTTNIFDKPLGSLTLSEILKTAGFIAMAVWLVRCLFNPMDDDAVKRAWMWLGAVLLAAGLVLFVYLRQ